jgi:hypothetical protein
LVSGLPEVNYSSGFLRNGHLHTDTLLAPGCPDAARVMVMAETQSCQSSFTVPCFRCRSLGTRQDSAVCVSLPSDQLVKEQTVRRHLLAPPFQVRFRNDEVPTGVVPVEEPRS